MDVLALVEKLQQQLALYPLYLVIIVGVIGLALDALVVWMACILVGAEKMDYLRSVGFIVLKRLLTGGLLFGSAFAVGAVLTSLDVTLAESGTLAIGIALALGIDVMVHLGLLFVLGSVSLGRGMVAWLIYLPLSLLIVGLVAGGVMIWLAIEQAQHEPAFREMLPYIGWALAVVSVLGVLIYVLTRYSQPTITRGGGK